VGETLATPLVAAASGAVAANNLAAHGMAMPAQAALAEVGRGGTFVIAARQNVIGAGARELRLRPARDAER
jgi:hypothetical protein